MNKSDHSIERKKPGRKPVDLQFDLKVEFVEITDDEIASYYAGIRWLLKLLHEVRDEFEREARTQHEDK